MQQRTTPDEIESLLHTVAHCIADLSNWLTQNKRQLNSYKTEAKLTAKVSSVTVKNLELTDSIISLAPHAKNCGVIDSSLTVEKHIISQLAETCFSQLRHNLSIREYLLSDASAKIVTVSILSRLRYRNSFSYLVFTQPLSPNSSELRTMLSDLYVRRIKTKEHVIPIPRHFHGLPVSDRIQYKIDSVCYKCISKTTPTYFSDYLQLYEFLQELSAFPSP